jgi:hypothetical protein
MPHIKPVLRPRTVAEYKAGTSGKATAEGKTKSKKLATKKTVATKKATLATIGEEEEQDEEEESPPASAQVSPFAALRNFTRATELASLYTSLSTGLRGLPSSVSAQACPRADDATSPAAQFCFVSSRCLSRIS